MCGRYSLHTNERRLAAAIRLALPEVDPARLQSRPGREMLTISRDADLQPTASMMLWGLRTPQNFHVNARIETADTAPRFRDNWEKITAA